MSAAVEPTPDENADRSLVEVISLYFSVSALRLSSSVSSSMNPTNAMAACSMVTWPPATAVRMSLILESGLISKRVPGAARWTRVRMACMCARVNMRRKRVEMTPARVSTAVTPLRAATTAALEMGMSIEGHWPLASYVQLGMLPPHPGHTALTAPTHITRQRTLVKCAGLPSIRMIRMAPKGRRRSKKVEIAEIVIYADWRFGQGFPCKISIPRSQSGDDWRDGGRYAADILVRSGEMDAGGGQ